MSRDTLSLGLKAGGGVLPGPEGVTVTPLLERVTLAPRLEAVTSTPQPLDSNPLPGPPPDLIIRAGAGSLSGPDQSGGEKEGGGTLLVFARGGGVLPGPPPDLVPSSSSTRGDGRGSQAGGVTTLTTPTLTPTTLRNIEQMFADRDPHEPPHYHQNAAGFVPPIISPTSGNSYVPMGQVTPLNCHRPLQTTSATRKESPSPSPPLEIAHSPPLPSFKTAHSPPLPSLQQLNTPSDLTTTNGGCRPPPLTKASRPTNLCLSRGNPPPLMEAPPRPRMLSLLRSPGPHSDMLTTPVVEEEQQQPSDLSITVRERPPQNMGMGQLSPVRERPHNLGMGQLSPVRERPHNLGMGQLSPVRERPQILGMGQLSPVRERPQSLGMGQLSPVMERPQKPGMGQLNLPNGAGHLLSHKLDMMDKFLKAVAASPVVQSNMNMAGSSSDQDVNDYEHSSTNMVPKEEPQVGSGNKGKKTGGRRPQQGEPGASPEEENRRAMRRERNKQAAARCRKRRMDLTSTLQGEVDQWEDKVRGLQEELLQLESQKKGLEAVLRRHQGPCKLAKTESHEN